MSLMRLLKGASILCVCLAECQRIYAGEASTNPAGSPPPLQGVYRWITAEGKQRFGVFEEARREASVASERPPLFFAIITNEWPTGVVPIFSVEKTNRVELRRRPARGVENSSEPLFFAVPPLDEPEAAKVAGRWRAEATHHDGRVPFLGWELAIEGENVSGRFDQNTDYRFAFITSGTFRTNRLELNVEYIMDQYVLSGEWHDDGRFSGKWRRSDNSESGIWSAHRDQTVLPPRRGLVALYEWNRTGDNARRYALDGENPGEGWQRSSRPLCFVWTEGERAGEPQ